MLIELVGSTFSLALSFDIETKSLVEPVVGHVACQMYLTQSRLSCDLTRPLLLPINDNVIQCRLSPPAACILASFKTLVSLSVLLVTHHVTRFITMAHPTSAITTAGIPVRTSCGNLRTQRSADLAVAVGEADGECGAGCSGAGLDMPWPWRCIWLVDVGFEEKIGGSATYTSMGTRRQQ